VSRLCEAFGHQTPVELVGGRFAVVELDAFTLRYERRTEFSCISLLNAALDVDHRARPFDPPMAALLPPGWLRQVRAVGFGECGCVALRLTALVAPYWFATSASPVLPGRELGEAMLRSHAWHLGAKSECVLMPWGRQRGACGMHTAH
jgi:hypothetical protein